MSAPDAAPPLHVMLDIETMGTRPGSAIASIGACTFGEGGTGRDCFEIAVTLVGQDRLGLTIDPETVLWWLGQSEPARDALRDGGAPLRDALAAFSAWLLNLRRLRGAAEIRIWGNGASFDPVLLEAAYRAADAGPPPWRYRQVRDLRTLLDLAGLDMRAFPSVVAHSALADAIAQATAAEAALKALAR